VRGIATPATTAAAAAAKANSSAAKQNNPRAGVATDAKRPRVSRPILEIPDDLKKALDDNGLWERYRARPPYQQNNYVGWVIGSKRPGIRNKRLMQFVDELRSGAQYMGSAYTPKK
jgi:uncharacterized protein YdeI (YjbR/CyaY-like superfamily)